MTITATCEFALAPSPVFLLEASFPRSIWDRGADPPFHPPGHRPPEIRKTPTKRLRYRHSVTGLATDPDQFRWTADLFTPTLHHLPGLPSAHEHFSYVTYPRFINSGPGRDMLVSFRTGKAGLGDDHLYVYRAAVGHFELVGTHLVGVQNNPYVHGMDVDGRRGRLHVTWVYRAFVHYQGWDDLLDTKHKQQAGPNGAENNHDICYAYSDDGGRTWRNTHNEVVADMGDDKAAGVRPNATGLVVFEIPKGSGLTNQESQAVGPNGDVHVLNRTFGAEPGEALWRHFYRDQGQGKVILVLLKCDRAA